MFLVAGMLISFIIHAIIGSLQLTGAQSNPVAMRIAAEVLMTCATLHIIVTVILSIKTLYAIKKSGAHYFKNNLLFWVRRISGLTIILPLIMHLQIFGAQHEGAYRLSVFTTGRLISQILLVVSIAFHVLLNVKPALLGFGIKGHKKFAMDFVFILSVLLLVFAVSFYVYYLRWMSN